MRGAVRLFLGALAMVAAAIPAAGPATAQERVTQAAVWRPAPGFLERFHKQCAGRAGAAFDACFARAMAKAGASPAALAFTARLGNEGYLQSLDEAGGPIAVAHVVFPFRANENDAWYLVNGAPPLIDVDDRGNLAIARMRSSPGYAAIHRRYPNVTFWPGDRAGAGPQVAPGGREFVVGYVLRDLCHACAIIGRVRYAFDFEADGKFLGARLVSIAPSAQ